MSETFTLPSGKIVAEVLDANSVCGSGNLESPILIFNLLMNLRGSTIPRSCLDFRELRCRISPFDRSYIAASLPSLLRVQLYANQELPKHSLNLEVPLDRIRIASLNRMRNGGDVKLRLDGNRPLSWGASLSNLGNQRAPPDDGPHPDGYSSFTMG
jgi:hypothetical protein